MKNNIERVCVVDTVYTLFLYLLISTMEEIKKTFFFFSSGIPEEIRSNFKQNSFYFDRNILSYKTYQRFCLEMRFLAKLLWPFLRNKGLTYWGHSHLFYSCGIIQNNKLNLIEDGVANYSRFNVSENIRLKTLKERIFGSFYFSEEIWGLHKSCCSIYLTDLMEIDDLIKEKVIHIDVESMWNVSEEDKRIFISKIFNIDSSDLALFDDKVVVLLTQCFSEDGYCSEISKVKMYKDIIEKYCSGKKLVIKPHPRELTDYSVYFPDAIVFKKRLPMEVLLLMGAQVNNVVTINSSVSYLISKSKSTEVTILGKDFLKKYK